MKKLKFNSYINATIFYIFGNGIGQGLILLSTIIFTRIMTKEGYGIYSTYYSTVSILNTLVGANLFNGLNNAYIDYKDDIHNYRSSNLFLSTLIFLGISVICICGNLIIGQALPFFLIVMALIHAYGFFIINYYNNSANMENRYVVKTILLILPNVFQVLFSIILILSIPSQEVNARVIGSTLGISVCAFVAYIAIIKGHKLVNTEYWKYGLRISVPSVLSSISSMVMTQSDTIMVTAFKGAEETAIYSLVYYIGYILYAVQQATNGVLQAWTYRTLDSKDYSKIKKVQKWYLYAFMVMALFLLMTAPEIVKILSPKNYWHFYYVGPFVLGSYLMVMYGFDSIVGMFHKKTTTISIIVLIAAVVNLALNAVFIPIYGGVAATVTSVTAYIIMFILFRILGNKLNKGLYSNKYFLLSFIAVLSACIMFEFIYSFLLIRYIVYSILLIISFIYVFLKKDEVFSIIKQQKG